MIKPIRLLPLLALLFAGCSSAGASEEVPVRGEAAPAAPNLVVVVTDDQTLDQFTRAAMPATYRFLVDEGVTFSNAVVTSPLCCPSRAAFLTGQYPHNNGVASNTYLKLRERGRVLPAFLQHAGYRTAHVGKYLNNYAKSLDDPADAAPGWDEWFTVLEPENYGNYSVSDDGEVVEYGWDPRDHLTRVLNDRAVKVAERLAAEPEPFYLQIDHYAPHAGKGNSGGGCPSGAAPERRDRGRVAGELPRKDSFGGDVADKAGFIRALPRLERRETERIHARYRCALEALAGVDRGVERVVTALRRAGELDETAIVFTSDNGYYFGEHRIASGKHFPYEEGIRVPLVIRPPKGLGAIIGARSEVPVANIDLAPTLLDLAKAEPCIGDGRCREPDGRSVVPLLKGVQGRWSDDRAVLIELDLPPSNAGSGARPCRFAAVRTARHVLINYTSGGAPGSECEEIDETELYSLVDDPRQTRNLLADPTPADERVAERLRATLSRLEDCRGRGPAPEGCP